MISRRLNEKDIKEAKRLIDKAEKIVITCHTSPDGDAIGSCLAAQHVLAQLGKDVRVVVPDAFLSDLNVLPGAKEAVDSAKYPDFAAELIAEAELLICLDFNTASRTGRLQQAITDSKAHKILIDHHLYPDMDVDVLISHPEMPATAYLLFRVLCRLELFTFINKAAAECILAGMMTDTGNFTYNCSDPELYIVTAELVKKGADKEKIYNALFNTHTEDCLRLNAYALLEKMEVFQQYGAALITLSRPELNRFHYVKGDTEGLVNRPLAIPGIKYSCFMRQEADCIRISMRSKGTFPVNKICAEHFGGGGHLNAAGGEFYGSLEDAANLFRSLLEKNMSLQ